MLNPGRELPPPQQALMSDSRKVGRLMAAVREEVGARLFAEAYFAFGEIYFDRSSSVDERLVEHVVQAVRAHGTSAAALTDVTLDDAVRQSHQASQNALGDIGGSPMITIDGRTVFGPVLTAVPDPKQTLVVFEAVTALVLTAQFSQLQRPRTHA